MCPQAGARAPNYGSLAPLGRGSPGRQIGASYEDPLRLSTGCNVDAGSSIAPRCNRLTRASLVRQARRHAGQSSEREGPPRRKAPLQLRHCTGGEGVLVGAFQCEREEETRDRAERGRVVRGSDQASVAPKRIPSPTQTEIYVAAALYRADEEVIASADKISW